MSEILEQTQEEAMPRFAVTDDSTAEWCLKKIKEAKADRLALAWLVGVLNGIQVKGGQP